MPKTIELEDGRAVEFPDDATEQEMLDAVNRDFPPPTSERQKKAESVFAGAMQTSALLPHTIAGEAITKVAKPAAGFVNQNVVQPLLHPVTTLQKGGAATLEQLGIISRKEYEDTVRLIDSPAKIPDVETQYTVPGKILGGGAQVVIDFVNAFSDPDMIGQIGLAGVAPAVRKVVLGKFALDMLGSSPQSLNAGIESAKAGDLQGAIRHVGGSAAAVALGQKLAYETIRPTGLPTPMRPEVEAIFEPEKVAPATTAVTRQMGIEPAKVVAPPTPALETKPVELQPATPELKSVEEKGPENAVPIRSPETVPVEVPPVVSEAVGARVPEPERPAVPREEAQPEAQKAKTEVEDLQKYAAGMVQSAENYIRRSVEGGGSEKDAALDWARQIGLGMQDISDATYKRERGGLYTSTYIKGVFSKRPVVLNAKEYLSAVDAGREEGLKWKKSVTDRQKALMEAPKAPSEVTPAEPPSKPSLVAEGEKKAAKEPWEMTQAEWNAATRFYRSGKTKNAQTPTGERVILRKEATEKTHANVSADFYNRLRGQAVAKALKEGKPVPPEVLADYPDLRPKRQKTPEQIRLQTEMDAAWNAVENAKLTWIYDQNASNPAAIRREIRKLPKTKRKIAERYESLLDEWVKSAKAKPEVPKSLVGMGGAVKGEIQTQPTPIGPTIARIKEKQAGQMEAKVKLPAQYDLERLDQQFKVFDEEIGDALTTGGQFLAKKLRPEVAKGMPAETATVTSKSVNQYFTSKLSTLVTEMRRIRSSIAQNATPEQLTDLDLITERAQHTFRQVQELRRTSHESLIFWNKIKAEMLDIQQALGMVGDIQRRLPILDQLWKDTRERNLRRSTRDVIEFLRINLFTLGSWTLDFATNMAVALTKLPAFAMGDMVSLFRGLPANRMAAALQATRMSAKNLVPLVEPFRLPQEIEGRLGTVAGAEFQGFGKEVMVDFSEILKDQPQAAEKLKKIDVLLSAPVRMKRATDNFFGRLGAATELYHRAYDAARESGVKGEDAQTFVSNFVKVPPKDAIDAAVAEGKEWKFNRDLSEWEEKFATNTITKAAIEAFPRWTFQFTRWAGEMLGANPVLYKKIKDGTATQDQVIDGLVKAATGWGGIIAFNSLIYDNIDANTMEYVKEDGDRVRLSGRTPAPELFFITALLRGDWAKAKAALPQTSFPLAKLLGGEPGGIISPVVDAMRESIRGNYTVERTANELTRLLNNAIPGKSVLGFMRALYDPTIREGLGAHIPGVAGLLPQKIEPTTGEPAAPMQRIPGTKFTFPTVGGTPFPGAVRDLNAIQAVLLNHGIRTVRPRRTSVAGLPEEDVPKSIRREYETLAGQNVKRIVGEGIANKEFWDFPPEIRRKFLEKWLNQARTQARNALAQKYETSAKQIKKEPIPVGLLPDKFHPANAK